MRSFCRRCDREVDVQAEDPRCPSCLRRSDLVPGEAQRGGPSTSPPDAAAPPAAAHRTPASLGLTAAAFVLLLLSMVPLELTSWMTLTDLCFVLAATGGSLVLQRSGFFTERPAATASPTALAIGGLSFGLLAALVFAGALALFSDPLAPQSARRFGPSHGWGLGTLALGVAVVIGQLSRMLLVKRFGRPPVATSHGKLVPLAGAGPALGEARDYRDGPRPKVVTLAEAAAALAALPGVRARLDGLRLQVKRTSDRSTLTLTAKNRPAIELGEASIETSDEHLALWVSHALLRLLGPHGVEIEGEVIAIDGSLSREELDIAHLQRMAKRLSRNQAELIELAERLKRHMP